MTAPPQKPETTTRQDRIAARNARRADKVTAYAQQRADRLATRQAQTPAAIVPPKRSIAYRIANFLKRFV